MELEPILDPSKGPAVRHKLLQVGLEILNARWGASVAGVVGSCALGATMVEVGGDGVAGAGLSCAEDVAGAFFGGTWVAGGVVVGIVVGGRVALVKWL